MEGAGVGEVGEGGRVGRPGLESCGCTGEDSRDKVEDSGGEETETLERMDKGKGREEVEEECDDKQSEMDIKVRGDEMEGVEEEIRTPVSSVQSNRVDKL